MNGVWLAFVLYGIAFTASQALQHGWKRALLGSAIAGTAGASVGLVVRARRRH